MQRVKTFDSTGVAPGGRLFAGDLNAIQDAAAAVNDPTQNILAAQYRIGETGLALLRYGAGIARITGSLFVDSSIGMPILSDSQRNALPGGAAPKGTLIYNTTQATLQVNDGTDGARVWRNIGALSYAQAQLSADVNFGASNTYVDGPSVSLSAGVWFVMAHILFKSTSVEQITGKLWNGTTIAASGQNSATNNEQRQLLLGALVSPVATQTWKVSLAGTSGSGTNGIKATPDNNNTGLTNTGSTISAIKVA